MLRKKLQAMTAVQDVTRHPTLLAEMSCDWPHSVRIVDSAHPIHRYTCLMHVFDFTEKPDYIAIASYGIGRVFAGPAFAHWLIERGLLADVTRAEAQDGDLVFYFQGNAFKHAGLWHPPGHVLSKWGTGHLYVHELFDAPESYGTEVRFYKWLEHADAYAVFEQFAEESGVRFG